MMTFARALLWLILGIFAAVIIVAAAHLASMPANADDEHMRQYHADPQYDRFFRSLATNPDAPGARSCCNMSDCHRVDAGQDASGVWWITLPAGGRLPVPPNRIIASPLSIDGEAYACLGDPKNLEGSPIRCFVPPIPSY